ncbi:neuronal acetylcholine receptor subunit alpha-7-like isoform X2 [Nelusetta ayraudi]|uniref:neuronal acetylcholine receptor subunit alpha-7-like isoform X2 n=1 Tax=Nelusetta ayraudi TaxID=303726 RepID=UPI003F70D63B
MVQPGALLFVAVAALMVEVSLQGPNAKRLYKDLMAGYNSMVRPVANESESISVKFGVTLRQIIDVDEKNQILTTNMWLNLQWTDYQLQWNVADYPGVSNLRFRDGQIWKPDILLHNSADERFDTSYHTDVLVTPTGSCMYIPPGIFKSSCRIDVRWFPFDVQRCELKFGSWTYSGWSLDLSMLDAEITDFIPNGEWDLVEVPGTLTQRVYTCCKEPYPDVTFTVVMRRRTLYYGINLLLPCILISILALLVFLLPADSGEKISLGITVLLSLTVFMLLVADIMPATSESVPLISQYFATIMVIVGLSVMATVIVLQFHHHDPSGEKMPKWIRVFLLNWCARFLCMKRQGEARARSACPNDGQQASLSSVELKAGASRSNNGNMLYPMSDSAVSGSGEAEKLLPATCSSSGAGVEPELSRILDEVHFIAKRYRNQDDQVAVRNEWRFAAAVIDRLCLVTFSLFIILCTFGILLSAPSFDEAVSKDFSN